MDAVSNDDKSVKTSELFCQQDSDVIFRSCDNILFHIHRKNLETNTGGFAPQGFETNQEIVPLTELSSTLELLFQFIYPQRHPDLEITKFEELCPLAEAAEKYQVYSALNICKIRMRNYMKEHSLPVMLYAAKHGYHDIVGETAPLLLHTPIKEMLLNLPPHLISPWVLYVNSWDKVFQNATSYVTRPLLGTRTWASSTYYDQQGHHVSQSAVYCASCNYNVDVAFKIVLQGLMNAQSFGNLFVEGLDKVFGDGICRTCCPHTVTIFATWRSSIEEDIAAIQPFVAYL